MKWTIAEIENVMRETFEKEGYDFHYDIKLNGRLTRSLGRTIVSAGVLSFDFSKQLLATATDDSIRQVILHEAAHGISYLQEGSPQGHNEIFRAICKRIGCNFDKSTADVERLIEMPEPVEKYTVYCKSCGRIGGYDRMGKTLKNLANCHCARCGSKEIYYEQNR